MPYVVTPQTPRHRQMTLDDLYNPWFNVDALAAGYRNIPHATVTRWCEQIHQNLWFKAAQLAKMIVDLHAKYRHLAECDNLQEHYRTFYIPKRNGKMRRIDAPMDDLKTALSELKSCIDQQFPYLHHTNAYAYIKERDAVKAVQAHQANKSRWMLKLDFSDFFGSTTYEFVWQQLTQIFPFSAVITYSAEAKESLRAMLRLCFLNGGLPQGTPMSPLLTNIMMIPIDHRITQLLNKYRFVYTRYADDINISHRYTFDSVFDHSGVDRGGKNGVDYIQTMIKRVLEQANAPFRLNEEKTRYGSTAGHNFVLGVCLNKDNNITIGHKKKKLFKATLFNYIQAKMNHQNWPIEEVQAMRGTMSYYRRIEQKYIDYVVQWYNDKFHIDLMDMIKEDLTV